MNDKVEVSPELILKYDFKHLFTYRLLFHIMGSYNIELNKVELNKQKIIKQYNSNYKTINIAIRELLDKGIIAYHSHDKAQYKVKTNFIVKHK